MSAVLARSADLADGRPLLVSTGGGPLGRRLILLRRGPSVAAYVNACPHMGIMLDWVAERVLSRDGRWLRCTGHGALFRPDDGLCVRGPCAGSRLTMVPVADRDGAIVLEDAPLEDAPLEDAP